MQYTVGITSSNPASFHQSGTISEKSWDEMKPQNVPGFTSAVDIGLSKCLRPSL